MAPRAPGLTRAAFQAHWRSEHAGVAAGLPGLRGYVQNHAVLGGDGEPLLRPAPPFDACSEIDFDDLEAMDAAFGSELYRGAVAADERSFIDREGFLLMLTERQVVVDAAPGPYKLLTFLREDAGAALPAAPGRHERLHVLPRRGGAPWAQLDLRWLDSPEEATRVPGTLQLVARPVRVA